MKVMLIAPSSGKWQRVGRSMLFNGKTFRFSLLSLLSVAADTPADIDVEIIDEQVEDIPWDSDADLVGITCMTALAPRAYEIAARFRMRGVPVVLGGIHPTLCPVEAAQHADAVVVGDAEGVWSRVLADAKDGRLKGTYRREAPHDLQRLPRIPRHLIKRDRYATVHAVQATRGCENSCDFCSIAAASGRRQRRRPIEEVVREVAEIPDRFFLFVDDNLTADRKYATALFEALEPLGKRWATQSTLTIAEDPAFVRAAADAGCIGLFVGLETFSDDNLDSVKKTCNRVERYREAIRLLHAHGIGIEAGVVFGFDKDDPSVFRKTLQRLDDLEIDLIQASVFTPLPGTPRFETMKHRIIDFDWAHYDFHSVVFQPQRMSPRTLQAGHDWVTREFYRPWRIARRLARQMRRPNRLLGLPYYAAVNLAYYGRVVRWGIDGWDPVSSHEAVAAVRPRFTTA